MKITKLKTTGEVVHEIHRVDGERTMVLFPFNKKSTRGKLGHCQVVKNSKLVTENEIGYAG